MQLPLTIDERPDEEPDKRCYLALGEAAMTRDPRRAPYGYFSGGTFVLDSTRVFQWFDSLDAMGHHMLEVEPRVHDLDHDDLPAYQERLRSLIARLSAEGLSDRLRNEINQALSHTFRIEWWGEFNELVSGNSEFACGIRSGFLDDQECARIESGDLEAFIEYLQTFAV
jgi:hypothetical protein